MAGQITRQGEGFEVAAELIADGLKLPLEQVSELMRAGEITTRCEKGEGDDEGRWRLSFLHQGRTFRLTVDGTGNLLSRSSFGAPRETQVAP